MRLLNIDTLKFKEFFEIDIPPYAILSHRWNREELCYKDFAKGRGTGLGQDKITNFCKLVREHRDEFWRRRLDWAWVDTCCIDARSSAELSEAINSMYAWYREAEVCFVYLADVRPRGCGIDELRKDLRGSAWFTRGWTLQELLAPFSVVFCTSSWEPFGHKCFHGLGFCTFCTRRSPDEDRASEASTPAGLSLNDDISTTTGIDAEYLSNPPLIVNASVACKMSWAARRTTTRKEDVAYSLLGLFDVNLPLLYGEGNKAFLRLQEELLRRSNDHSIFAWSNIDQDWPSDGMLAPTPAYFGRSGKVVKIRKASDMRYALSNEGLEITVSATKLASSDSTEDDLRAFLLDSTSLEGGKEGGNIDRFCIIVHLAGGKRLHPEQPGPGFEEDEHCWDKARRQLMRGRKVEAVRLLTKPWDLPF